MNEVNKKCVMVIDGTLPTGIIANTAAALGVSLGKQMPELVGAEVEDSEKKRHLGIVNVPIAMLQGSRETLKRLRETLYCDKFKDIVVIDFSNVAQRCNAYSQYQQEAAATPQTEYEYLGIVIYGDKKQINKLTGSMPLLKG